MTSISCLLLLAGCAFLKNRNPAGIDVCRENGVGCPFLNIGHRGAPLTEAENTIRAFDEAMRQGANALEIDLVMTAEGEVAVYHDRNPNDLIAVIRQMGLENQKYVPWVPSIGSDNRVEIEKLTLPELRKFYGYALRKGVIKDRNAIIPTIEDFSSWGNKQEKLEAVFLDIKLVPGHEGRAALFADKFAAAFANSHYRVYMMTTYESIYVALQEWINAHPSAPNRFLTLDMEKSGATKQAKILKDKLKRSVKSLSLGSTIFRSWNGYIKELSEVLNKTNRRKDLIYPVVAWTIDDEKKLYKILQMGADGILTNRPDRLNRLVNRHWKDHSTAAKTLASCFDQSRRERIWKICALGSQVAPLGIIYYDDIRSWVCEEKSVHPTLKDFYGCGGLGDKKNINFNTAIEDDSKVVIYNTPSGDVNVVKIPVEPKETDQVIFLQYQQTKCNDGILNYKCEYKLQLEHNEKGRWAKVSGIPAFKNSFGHFFVLPKSTQVVRMTLSETDNGVIDDTSVASLNLSRISTLKVAGAKEKFEGNIKLITQDIAPFLQRNSDVTQVALEFLQKDCYDGVLNYRCEYKIEVELMNNLGRISRVLGQNMVMKDSFIVYADLPLDILSMKVKIMEMDKTYVSSTSEFIIQNQHGESLAIEGTDGIFRGDFTVKILDYNEALKSSEGDEGFIPHGQRQRGSKKLKDLHLP